MIDLLEPDVIIIGGGVAPMMKPFFGRNPRPVAGVLRQSQVPGNSPRHGLLWRGCRDRRGSGAGGGRGFGCEVGL